MMKLEINSIGIENKVEVYDDFKDLSLYEIYKKAISKFFIKEEPFEFKNFEYSSKEYFLNLYSDSGALHLKNVEGQPYIKFIIKNNHISIDEYCMDMEPSHVILIAQRMCNDLNRLYEEGQDDE